MAVLWRIVEENKGSLQLLPSKKNPRVKRWQLLEQKKAQPKSKAGRRCKDCDFRLIPEQMAKRLEQALDEIMPPGEVVDVIAPIVSMEIYGAPSRTKALMAAGILQGKRVIFYDHNTFKSENNLEAQFAYMDLTGLMKKLDLKGLAAHEYGHLVARKNGGTHRAGLNLANFMTEVLGGLGVFIEAKWELMKEFGDYMKTSDAEFFAEMYRIHRSGLMPKNLKFVSEYMKNLQQ